MFPSATKDDTVHTLKNSAQNLKDEARNTAEDVKSDLHAAANKSGRKVREFIDNARDEIEHAGEAVSARIHERPVQSTLAALGVGFVLGLLYRR